MTARLAHRGPDGEAIESLAPGVCFGHRRLAILDLSDRGRQPMRSADGRWSIVFNGEIFNYRELRDELNADAAAAAPRWRSETDTEVLLEAVAAWGLERALERSVGMFAFALWDHQRREAILVRDRAGEKPVVYFHDGKCLAFASELKALEGLHTRKLDARAVDTYLALGYIPAPLAIFEKTAKLQAGHLLRFRDGEVKISRWWCPETAVQALDADRDVRAEELRTLVARATRQRLRSDVPVALSLSGGLDSSVIAAELRGQEARPDAFTVKFDGAAEETETAACVARRLGLRHHVLEAPDHAAADRMAKMIATYDEPFADSSALPSLALAEALGGRYKVILNGDGGDEAFGGYPHYEYVTAKQALKAAAASVGLRDGSSRGTVYVESKTLFRESERAGLLPAESGGQAAGALTDLLTADGYQRAGAGLPAGRTALKRALWSDRHLYLANDLTHKMDMALSAYGVEGRAPLLDHRLLEWAQNLSDRDLVRGRQKKVLLREAYAGRLPAGILNKPKRGFGAPVAKWLDGPLREAVGDLVPSPLLEKTAQREAVAHPGGQSQRLWTLLTFAWWAKQWRASW